MSVESNSDCRLLVSNYFLFIAEDLIGERRVEVILDDDVSFAYEIDGHDFVRFGDICAIVSLFCFQAIGGRCDLQFSMVVNSTIQRTTFVRWRSRELSARSSAGGDCKSCGRLQSDAGMR